MYMFYDLLTPMSMKLWYVISALGKCWLDLRGLLRVCEIISFQLSERVLRVMGRKRIKHVGLKVFVVGTYRTYYEGTWEWCAPKILRSTPTRRTVNGVHFVLRMHVIWCS